MGDGESVYNLAGSLRGKGPKIIKYNSIPAQGSNAKVKMHADSSQIEGILNPVRGVRDAQVRAGITPVNHARNNVHAVREVSRMNSLKKLQETEDAAVSAIRSSRPPSRRTSTSAGGAGPAGNPPSSRPDTAASQRNFVSENKVVAAAGVARGVKAEKRSEQQEAYLVKQDYGRVPQYLLERKLQMAAEYDALLAAKEAALVPPGMRILPEEERLETLAILEQNRMEIDRQIQGLPIIIETPSMIRRKEDLERRLCEIEDAVKVFSRPKVLVHVPAA